MNQPTLSEDLHRLEEIVRKLEDSDLPLEEAIELFEQGVKHLNAANRRLAETETRVNQVLRDSAADGGLKLAPLDE